MLTLAACINGETAIFGIYYEKAHGWFAIIVCMNGEIVIFGICYKEAVC